MRSLEAAIPTEVVALYTAIIASCQSVLNQNAHMTYLPLRLAIYLVGLLCTIVIAYRAVRPAAGEPFQTARSPEFLTATLAFTAWGLLLPGSFLYVWLRSPLLSIVVTTITAATAFLLAAVFAPKLRSPEISTAEVTSGGPPMTETAPGN